MDGSATDGAGADAQSTSGSDGQTASDASGPRDAATPTDTGSPDSSAPTSDARSPSSDAAPLSDAAPEATGPLGDAAAGGLLLVGTVVTPDMTFDGQVLVQGSVIVCAQPGTACASTPAGALAVVLDTHGGVIAPGLIDTHNHILFDIFDGDDWLPSRVYTNHTQWPSEPRYQAMLDVKQCLADDSQGKPTWCPTTYTGSGSLRCEMDKFGELKGLVAGTTSIVGLPGTSSGCFSSLARSIDTPQNGFGGDAVYTATAIPTSKTTADGVCANFASGKAQAYLVHCGEGTDSTALGEFAKLGSITTTPDCLQAPETTITHGTAFTATEFGTMAADGMKLTWSPASNIALYGATTNIPAALAAGLVVTVAPDWSMGGSQNILDEMRFADAWDDMNFGNVLSSQDLVTMVTEKAATVVHFGDRIGQIKEGYVADLMVVPSAGATPYDAILAARPKDVMLTMVGGVGLYGDATMQAAAPVAPGCETIDICGVTKFLCVATTDSTDKLDQTYAQVTAVLGAALANADSLTPTDGYEFAPLAPLLNCN